MYFADGCAKSKHMQFKQFFLGLLLVFTTLSVAAQQSEKLEKLLQERYLLNEAWEESQKRKSGFFGNRTKADMQKTISTLERILRKDNEIVDELTILTKNEKFDLVGENADLANQVLLLNRKLANAQQAYQDAQYRIDNEGGTRRFFEILSLLGVAGTGVFGWLYWKQRNSLLLSGLEKN